MKNDTDSAVCEKDKFYIDGLHFKCKEGCIKCCSESPGVVFLTDEDLVNISKAVGLTKQEAKIVYTRIFTDESNERFVVLKEYSNNKCIFLSDKGCKIYPYRPIQCSTYPFWDRVLESKDSWQKEKEMCPCIDDESGFVDADIIKEQLEKYNQSRKNLLKG